MEIRRSRGRRELRFEYNFEEHVAQYTRSILPITVDYVNAHPVDRFDQRTERKERKPLVRFLPSAIVTAELLLETGELSNRIFLSSRLLFNEERSSDACHRRTCQVRDGQARSA